MTLLSELDFYNSNDSADVESFFGTIIPISIETDIFNVNDP